MSAPADLPFDLDSLSPAVSEAFAAIQAKVTELEVQTERQDCLVAELRHALNGRWSEQRPPMRVTDTTSAKLTIDGGLLAGTAAAPGV